MTPSDSKTTQKKTSEGWKLIIGYEDDEVVWNNLDKSDAELLAKYYKEIPYVLYLRTEPQ